MKRGPDWWRSLTKRKKAPTTLRLLTWNTKVGRRPRKVVREVRQMTRALRPHVVTLQEAKGYVHALKAVEGYTVLAATGSAEAGNCVTLIRNDVPYKRVKGMKMAHRWVGPKAGKAHEGRTFLRVDLGKVWRVVNTHRTRPGWSPDAAAFREEDAALEQLAARPGSKRRHFVSIGDQNIGTRPGRDHGPNTPAALAEKIGADIAAPSSGRVDYAIVRGADTKTVRSLGKHGSDHEALLIVLIADKEK